MEINYDKKYSGRKLKGSEYAAFLNLINRISRLCLTDSSKKSSIIHRVILFPNQRKNWQRAVLSYVFTYERCQFWHDKRGDYAKMTNEETKVILTIQNQLWYNTAVRTCDAI